MSSPFTTIIVRYISCHKNRYVLPGAAWVCLRFSLTIRTEVPGQDMFRWMDTYLTFKHYIEVKTVGKNFIFSFFSMINWKFSKVLCQIISVRTIESKNSITMQRYCSGDVASLTINIPHALYQVIRNFEVLVIYNGCGKKFWTYRQTLWPNARKIVASPPH